MPKPGAGPVPTPTTGEVCLGTGHPVWEAWTAARGLCTLHTWCLIERSDEATAAAYAPLVSNLRDRLRSTLRTSGSRPDGRAVARLLAPEQPCPACHARALAESRAAFTLAGRPMAGRPAGDGQRAAEAPLEAGAVLCLGHLALTLDAAWRLGAREAARRIIAHQQHFYDGLEWHLSEFIRKQDDRFRHEPRGIEQRAPRVVLRLVAGERGVR